jgi:hypothetical protein
MRSAHNLKHDRCEKVELLTAGQAIAKEKLATMQGDLHLDVIVVEVAGRFWAIFNAYIVTGLS